MKKTNRSEPRTLTKVEIVRRLSDLSGYKSYLEICTPTTGLFYASVDRSKFEICHRMMYQCPDNFDDGMEIDFRSSGLDISNCIDQIKERNLQYDIALVDSWHEYETSLRDLEQAFSLIRSGGTIVVHDCLPPSEDVAVPHFISGDWAGVTYQAYLNFVFARNDLKYFTVDSDWGCGVIRKISEGFGFRQKFRATFELVFGKAVTKSWSQAGQQSAVIKGWSEVSGDHRSAYAFLIEHKRELLNLISVDEFLRDHGECRRGMGLHF